MTFPVHTLFIFYQLAGIALTLYGCFLLVSIFLYGKSRPRHDWPLHPQQAPDEWPQVTIQLPIYNEPQVALRVVRAVASLQYPLDKLEIQVLDDSTDRTSAALAQGVSRLRKKGIRVVYAHRWHRQGYKAGALAAGLQSAKGEYIAIFDADFVPESDWLIRILPVLINHPQLAFVQSRWEHLNWSQSALTAAQSLALDGHFAIEQQARSASGFLQNFNGSGGIWRRVAIDSVGGWSSDTVTEDLDLSYRVQLAGWGGAYVNQITVPAEVPPLISGFKRQQKRWAKGSMQTLRKLAGAVVHSHLPLGKRLYALFHLGGYAIHLPLLLLLALSLPLALAAPGQMSVPLLGTISSLVSVAPFLMYGLAQHQLRGQQGLRRLWALPFLALISLGLSPAMGQAVVSGLLQKGGAFERTPKQGDGPRTLALPESSLARQLLPEFLTLVYALLTLLVIVRTQQWQLAPLPLLYLLGTGFVLSQAWHEQRLMRRRPQKQGLLFSNAYHSSDIISR
ncbi:MAG: glycosyltransferase [Chloroflexi bacterium]|nr:glycosyltransferase [Chloroflexota bacterium]